MKAQPLLVCWIGIRSVSFVTSFQLSEAPNTRTITAPTRTPIVKPLCRSFTPISMTSAEDEEEAPPPPPPPKKEDNMPIVVLSDVALTKIGSTTSAVVAGTFFAVLAYQRDALMVSFFIGAISNGILSKVLKKVLKQARPPELNGEELDSSFVLAPTDNGMPSSHAMSLGFICTFAALQLPSWTALPLLVYVVISLMYRVQRNLHTVEQILVGVTVGATNGYVWRILCFGNNPWGVNVMDWVSATFLNEQGLLPWYGLAVPTLVGAAVVGSVERRISKFLKNRPKEE